jgi:plastocyanin
MFEYRFDLAPTTVPSGPVTFVITNRGAEVHNFSISGVKNGAFLNPGGAETWTVGLPAGRYDLVCDVPFHIGAGMVGQLVVSP